MSCQTISQCYASAVRRVTSRKSSVVAVFRDAANGESPDLVLLDGHHLVADALAAGYHLEHVIVSDDGSSDPEIAVLIAAASKTGAQVSLASAAVMAAVSPVRSPSPVVALARRPAPGSVYSATHALVVVACDVQDPGNLGAMTRVAEAAGASGLVAAGHCADPFGWKALRGSMGSALRLPVSTCATAEAAVGQARQHGCRSVAAVPRGGRSIYTVDLAQPVALLVGGEGGGLSSAVVAAADECATIPMRAPVESLNAAVAVALLVYEARRQRG